jgi:hypothetical protein
LQIDGSVESTGQQVEVLSPRQDLTGAERRWAPKYDLGDVVRYSRGSEALGIRAGEYATVQEVNAELNELTVSFQDGRSLTYDPRRLQGVNVFKSKEIELAAGDRIQFTSPFRKLDVPNREMGDIEAIDHNENLRIRLDSGKSVEFNLTEHSHVDYGYAVTSYSGQGQTADRVLIHVDTEQSSNLVNERFGYVALSRARYDAQIYTDDASELTQSLSRQISKSSALDSYERQLSDRSKDVGFDRSADDSITQHASNEESVSEQGQSHGKAQTSEVDYGIDN